ncbi:MAG: putative addiction module antidote protein [Holophagaceae bacterium]|nr:putative addiction module antidote protein [Holophagaceae bacterium]
MTQSTKTVTRRYGAARHLQDEASMAAYLEAAMEGGDPRLIAVALGAIARAKGMTEVARAVGLSRESLYRALSEDGNPELGTILKVVHALGMRLRPVVE